MFAEDAIAAIEREEPINDGVYEDEQITGLDLSRLELVRAHMARCRFTDCTFTKASFYEFRSED